MERQNKALKLEVDGWFNKSQEIHESMIRQDKVNDKFRQQNKRYREALEDIIELSYSITAVEEIAKNVLEESE